MRRVVIIFLLIILTGSACFANSYATIDKLENSIFGMTYSGQDEKSRIERLEKNIYGAIQSGSLNTRLTKLSNDMIAEKIGEEIEPTKYTEFEEQEDNTVDYPLINELEQKVFNKEFKSKKLEQRLSDLEKSVFNRTFEKEDLSSRTERLKASVHINKKAEEVDTYFNYDEPVYNYNDYAGSMAAADELPAYKKIHKKKYDGNIAKILNALEKKVLKRTYSNDDEETRIERLEENIFSTSFPQDSIESRLERLALAYQASKSAKKYDTNKISQHMGTAMQVGMFLLMILAMVL